MIDFAFGAKSGLPVGGAQPGSVARAMPSRWSMAPSARPAKPMPKSARKVRRETRPQQEVEGGGGGSAFIIMLPSVGGDTLNLSDPRALSQQKAGISRVLQNLGEVQGADTT